MPREQESGGSAASEEVVRESREASLRSQGGGSADEEAIRRAAREDPGAEGDQPSRSSDASTS